MAAEYRESEIRDLRMSMGGYAKGPYADVIGYTGYIGVVPGDKVAVTTWNFMYKGPLLYGYVNWGIKKGAGDWPADLLDNLVAYSPITIAANLTADFILRSGTCNAVMTIPASITGLAQQIGVHYWISPTAPIAGVALTLADRISAVGQGNDVLRVFVASELTSLNVQFQKVV